MDFLQKLKEYAFSEVGEKEQEKEKEVLSHLPWPFAKTNSESESLQESLQQIEGEDLEQFRERVYQFPGTASLKAIEDDEFAYTFIHQRLGGCTWKMIMEYINQSTRNCKVCATDHASHWGEKGKELWPVCVNCHDQRRVSQRFKLTPLIARPVVVIPIPVLVQVIGVKRLWVIFWFRFSWTKDEILIAQELLDMLLRFVASHLSNIAEMFGLSGMDQCKN
jgi:hypothetical protein